MIALALMLALSQAKPIEVSEERERPRVKAALSVGGGPILPILSPFPSNSPSSWAWAWAGLAVEGGVVLNDRIVFSGRASFFTNFGALALGGNAGLDFSDHFALGAGSACSGWRAPSEASRE